LPSDFAAKARTYNIRARQLRSIDDAARDAYVKAGNRRLPELQLVPSATLKTFDWRKYGKVTGVKDQKSCGSCWDFAALAAYESNYLIRNNLTVDSSEQQILDCSGAGSCKGGSHTGVFDFLIGTGDGMDADYGVYQGKEGTCQSGTNNPYRAVAWGLVTDETIPNSPNLRLPTVAELKQALVDNGPLAVCLLATPHFQDYTADVFEEGKKAGETIFDDWTKVTYTYESNGNAYALDKNGKKFYGTNHVVLLIGWDDNTGAWLIKNSWGTNWGNPAGLGTERGYGWIKYNTDNIGHYAAWVRAKNKSYILPKEYYKVLPTIKPMPEPDVHPDPIIKANPITKKPSGQ
jgi:cathepsin L